MTNLNVAEAAKILKKTEKAVRQDIFRGKIPFRRMGRKIIIPSEDLEKFLRLLPGRSAEEAAAKVNEL